MRCNQYSTNAPIICTDAQQALDIARKRQLQLVLADDDSDLEAFLATVVDASKTGKWCCIDADTVSAVSLRECIYRVWLKGAWDHHENFRAWVVKSDFVPLRSAAEAARATIHSFQRPAAVRVDDTSHQHNNSINDVGPQNLLAPQEDEDGGVVEEGEGRGADAAPRL